MQTTLAEIKTPSIRVVVTDTRQPKPVEQAWYDPHPIVAMLFRPPGYRTEFHFTGAPGKGIDRMGDIFYVAPDTETSFRGYGEAIKSVTCLFELDFFERTLGGAQSLTSEQFQRSLDIKLSSLPGLMTRLVSEALSPGFVHQGMAEALGGVILVDWARYVGYRRDESQSTRTGLNARHIRAINDYLDGLEIGAPSVSAMANLCRLSESHLCRRFREQTGESIGRYLQSLQIRRAVHLLLDTTLPLKEIAFRLGFATPGNFSTAFRTATGSTPGAFRALY